MQTQEKIPLSRNQASPDPDQVLINKARQGDTQAFELLVKQYSSQVYRLALMMMKNERDAEEVAQETFLNVYLKLETFRGDSKFSSWLYRVTANCALMRLRKQQKGRTLLLDDLLPQFEETGSFEQSIHDWTDQADRQLENQELGEKIKAAIEQLPDRYRIILLMRDSEGLSNEDIATTLGLSVPAVKSILHRSRLYVREQLNRYFEGQ